MSAKENAKKRKADGMFQERDGMDLRDEPSDEVNRISKLVVGAAIEVHSHLGPGHMESAYLRATGKQLGLILNFNVSMLKEGIKRVILTH